VRERNKRRKRRIKKGVHKKKKEESLMLCSKQSLKSYDERKIIRSSTYFVFQCIQRLAAFGHALKKRRKKVLLIIIIYILFVH
jgi:hypothetical protein